MEGLVRNAENDFGEGLPTGISLVTSLHDERWRRAEDCERRIFAEYGYTHDNYNDEYSYYAPVTHWLIAENGPEVAGVMRIIVPGAEGFKTFNDSLQDTRSKRIIIDDTGWSLLAEIGMSLAPVTPLPTMIECNIAVVRTYQSGSRHAYDVSNMLLAAVIAYASTRAAVYDPTARPYAIASGDSRYLRLFRMRYGGEQVVRSLGPVVPYMGTPTQPVAIDICAMLNYDKKRSERLLV